jgi:hypothetical protein
MKKLLFIAAILFVCCTSRNELEKTLYNYVQNPNVDLKYKLISYTIDTITVEKKIDGQQLFGIEPDKEKFLDLRNQEFKDFGRDAKYEEQIMRGELKDASEWCTLLRINTEKADFLLQNWDQVTATSYEYIYLTLWYGIRKARFVGSEQIESSFNEILENVVANKDEYKLINKIQNSPKDSILYFSVLHKYSIFNPLVDKRVDLTDSLIIAPNMEILKKEDKTNFFETLIH